jgi:5'-nucleotidase
MDGAVIGNHEFDLGSANLYTQISEWASFPLLAANYVFEDSTNPDASSLRDVIEPYKIYDVDGIKIGVIGMANWSSMTGIFEGGNSLGIRPIEDSQALDRYVRLLRPVVDLVVVVSHLGLDEDEGLTQTEVEDENEGLARAGVDLILGGHLHIVTDPPKLIPNDDQGHSTVLVHSGAFARYVGRLDVVVRVGDDNNDPARRSRITGFAYRNLPVDSRTADDPEVAELLFPYSVAINKDYDLDGVIAWVNPPGEAKVTRNDTSGGDSQLGNLVARSMQTRAGVEAEFALTNSLGIRADFERGQLTIEQMFNVFPFENSITVMYLSGTEIQETFDFVARKSAERGCRSQAQVAGLWFDMVCRSSACPDSDPDDDLVPTACARNIYLGENCRGGDPDGPIDPSLCRPVLADGLYRVAVNDYIARGGSGYVALKRNTSKQDTGVPLRDSLQVFMRSLPPCSDTELTDPEDPNSPTVVAAYGVIPCIGADAEPHDGRIRPVFE